jgi:hypothetical protein
MPSKCVDLFQKVDNSNTGITLANQPANPQGKPQYMATILPGSVMAEMLSKTDIVLSRLGHEKKNYPFKVMIFHHVPPPFLTIQSHNVVGEIPKFFWLVVDLPL